MMHAQTKATIRLFNRRSKDDDKPDVVYPVLVGFIENANFRLQVAAFKQLNPKTEKEFLSLSIGLLETPRRFGGTLYRDEKPGKAGRYFGYISETIYCGEKDGKPVYASGEWQLAINARRIKTGRKKPYIGGEIYPLKTAADSDEEAVGAEMAF